MSMDTAVLETLPRRLDFTMLPNDFRREKTDTNHNFQVFDSQPLRRNENRQQVLSEDLSLKNDKFKIFYNGLSDTLQPSRNTSRKHGHQNHASSMHERDLHARLRSLA